MKGRTVLLIAFVLVAISHVVADQPSPSGPQTAPPPRAVPQTVQPAATPAPTPTPSTRAAAAAIAPPRRVGQPINVKIEFTLTDQRAGSAPIKRTMSVIVADGGVGQVRSQADVIAIGPVPLNIDTNPEIMTDGKIRLGFNLQYDFFLPVDDKNVGRGTVAKTSMHDSVSLILENGKPMIAAQSADPITDRQVTVEVKATILR